MSKRHRARPPAVRDSKQSDAPPFHVNPPVRQRWASTHLLRLAAKRLASVEPAYHIHDLPQIILDLNRVIRVRGRAHSLLAQYPLELFGVVGVIGDGRRRILKLMPGENAHDPVAGCDHFFAATASRRPRWRLWPVFAPESPRPNLGLGIKDLLIADPPDDPLCDFQRPQCLLQIDWPVDLDGRCQRRCPAA